MKRFYCLLALLLLILLAGGCAAPMEEKTQFDQNEIVTVQNAEELLQALQEGAVRFSLASSISMDEEMLALNQPRKYCLLGNGNSLSGQGDCVIRLENGASLELKDITVQGGSIGIGCMDDSVISAINTTVKALDHGIYAANHLSVAQNSSLLLQAQLSTALFCKTARIEQNASLQCESDDQALYAAGATFDVEPGASVCCSGGGYSAVKINGVLTLKSDSTFEVCNTGDYHGGEIGLLSAEEPVTIRAKGGNEGVGLFIAELEDDIQAYGYCEPAPRYEVQEGTLTFLPEE